MTTHLRLCQRKHCGEPAEDDPTPEGEYLWHEWIEEGDAAGTPETGEEWGWWTKHSKARLIVPGDRFYVVAHGMLRGYAIVTRLAKEGPIWIICRKGGAVACTIDEPIPGFRGLEERWWPRERERPFPDWQTAGIAVKQPRVKPAKPAPLFEAR